MEPKTRWIRYQNLVQIIIWKDIKKLPGPIWCKYSPAFERLNDPHTNATKKRWASGGGKHQEL